MSTPFLPLFLHHLSSLFGSGVTKCVWDSVTVFPPPPHRTLTGSYKKDSYAGYLIKCALGCSHIASGVFFT